MTILKKIKSHPNVVDCFKELSFYNKQIKKPKIKRLKMLICSLNFLFMKNWMLVEKKDLIKQLVPSKSSIKGLFSGVLNKTNGFKYQITLKVTLKKYKTNWEI